MKTHTHNSTFLFSDARRASKESRRVLIFALAVYAAMALGGVAQGADRDANLVAAVLVLEAGGEPSGGMEAVMSVIDNRAHHDSTRYAEIVTARKQFSCLNNVGADAAIAKAKRHPKFVAALAIVARASAGELEDSTDNATNYYADTIPAPYWTHKMRQTASIGHHRFFRSNP